jgi:hypothetical protein
LWYFHVCTYYNPIWFSSFYLSPFIKVVSVSLRFLHSFL